VSIAVPFVGRALATWVVARALVTALVVVFGGAADGAPFALARPAAVLTAALVTVVCLLDVARRRELVLLGNFGVSRARLVAWCAAPAIAGELLLATLAGAWR
jgi:hypothetical protein